jgi:DNA-binding transcriptional regulator PaaX
MAKQYGAIAREILLYVATVGAIALALTSPYAASALLKAFQQKGRFREQNERQKFFRALNNLKKSRLVIMKEKKDGTFLVELTERGKRKVEEMEFENLQIPKPPKWDGIWRVVLFDIPRKKNKARDALRQKLQLLGFCQLQESAWVFPYPCTKEVEFIVEFFHAYSYVHIVQGKIKKDAELRKHFHLLL